MLEPVCAISKNMSDVAQPTVSTAWMGWSRRRQVAAFAGASMRCAHGHAARCDLAGSRPCAAPCAAVSHRACCIFTSFVIFESLYRRNRRWSRVPELPPRAQISNLSRTVCCECPKHTTVQSSPLRQPRFGAVLQTPPWQGQRPWVPARLACQRGNLGPWPRSLGTPLCRGSVASLSCLPQSQHCARHTRHASPGGRCACGRPSRRRLRRCCSDQMHR